VYVPKDKINTNKLPKMAKKENDNNPMVIIGGGPASESAIEALRKAGHKGKIVLITKDNLPPYDRTSLSKRWDCEKNNVTIRTPEFYEEYGIDILTDSTVNSIDYVNKTVNINNGQKVEYDKLLIASGCRNVPPNNVPKIPGLNMYSLRTLDDFHNIKQAIEGLHDRTVKNITVVGGGFIGWEIASTLKSTYKDKV
jgi:NADPH-dependent 2,4-dienoyl-CoA reductase/sulfur reductase-like enzyme